MKVAAVAVTAAAAAAVTSALNDSILASWGGGGGGYMGQGRSHDGQQVTVMTGDSGAVPLHTQHILSCHREPGWLLQGAVREESRSTVRSGECIRPERGEQQVAGQEGQAVCRLGGRRHEG